MIMSCENDKIIKNLAIASKNQRKILVKSGLKILLTYYIIRQKLIIIRQTM